MDRKAVIACVIVGFFLVIPKVFGRPSEQAQSYTAVSGQGVTVTPDNNYFAGFEGFHQHISALPTFVYEYKEQLQQIQQKEQQEQQQQHDQSKGTSSPLQSVKVENQQKLVNSSDVTSEKPKPEESTKTLQHIDSLNKVEKGSEQDLSALLAQNNQLLPTNFTDISHIADLQIKPEINVDINPGHDQQIFFAPGNEHHYEYPKYRLQYEIDDPNTGDKKQYYEEKGGDKVTGQYALVDPVHGRIHTVDYAVDDNDGFKSVFFRDNKDGREIKDNCNW